MPRFSVSGAELAYEVSGVGPTVIQAHGLSASRNQDDAMGLDFSAVVGRRRRLLRYDARGHGASTGEADPADYTWAHLAGDLLALAGAEADGPVDVIGASMGCGTALHAAVRHPEAIRRLVLVIPPTAWETRAAQVTGYLAGAEAVEHSGLRGFAELMQGRPLPPVLAEVPGLMMLPRVREALLPAVLRGAAHSDLPSLDVLAGLPMPTLVLPWIDDPGHPVSTAQALAETLPDARLHLARTHADVREWGRLAADFLAA